MLPRPDLTSLRCLDLAHQVFDGHNGVLVAVYSKEHLLEHVMSALPPDIGREDWLQALPRALVAGFVKADIDFQRKGQCHCHPITYSIVCSRDWSSTPLPLSGEVSGTTATLVVVDGFTVTVGWATRAASWTRRAASCSC